MVLQMDVLIDTSFALTFVNYIVHKQTSASMRFHGEETRNFAAKAVRLSETWIGLLCILSFGFSKE